MLLPLAAGFCDEIENALQIQVTLGSWPTNSLAFYVGAAAANLKWMLIVGTITALMLGLRRPAEFPQ